MGSKEKNLNDGGSQILIGDEKGRGIRVRSPNCAPGLCDFHKTSVGLKFYSIK